MEYLVECGHSHPSYESAMAYCDVNDGTVAGEPWVTVWQVPFATTHVLAALDAVRQAFDPNPWTDELQRLGQQYRDATDAVRQEDGLPPVEWSVLQDD
jgi:hypothetical protein